MSCNCIHQLFEEQVERTPDAVAIVLPAIASSYAQNEQLTYRELNQRANQLAHHLQQRGVGADLLVAVSLTRSIDLAIAILGILKAGGAYVPLDPAYPQERLAFMLSDTQAPIVLTQASIAAQLPSQAAEIICLDEDWATIAGHSTSNPVSAATLECLAYVIYTSGSTGNPKGVALEHRALVNLLLWQLQQSTLTQGARTLQFASLSFDVSFQELFATWCAGGTLVLISEELRRHAVSLLRFINGEQIERLFLPFIVLQHLAEAAESTGILPSSLREIVTAGEQLQITPYLVNLFTQLPHCTLHNQYGPSETHVVTAFTLTGTPDRWAALPPIGQAIANTQLYLLNEQQQPVPDGEPGELYIGGIGLARGYLNRPDLTADRFIPNPFLEAGTIALASPRLYKTGDLARRLANGNLEYIGRIDSQVKIRGFRIELGEIETALATHPAVKQAVVMAREEQPGKRLVAYLVAKDEQPLVTTELRQHLQERLPDYMIPAAFVTIAAMPQTPSGKIDRRALPAPSSERPQLAQAYVAPQSERECWLANLWSGLLQIDRVGIHDNFFELGGNSLLALQIVTGIQQHLQQEFSAVKLFEHSTIAGLAAYLGQELGDRPLFHRYRPRTHRPQIQRPQTPLARSAELTGIAIVGMAGRFPGADSVEALWRNLCAGVESITYFDDTALDASVGAIGQAPNYIKARGVLAEADRFDAAFFGINPREAEVMDPQQRVFLEIAWSALENAGYEPETFPGLIGVYAGTGNNTYINGVKTRGDAIEQVGEFQVMTANEKDYLATRISYKLNLTGPSVSIHTACSTSLVAVNEAFHSLMNHQCDMALAGGISITVPQNSGYLYQEGGMLSADGHCRPFDASAAGTVFSNGAGCVVLKRLADALEDGDRIYAVIRGAAINNDGADKMSFAAPSVAGQAGAIGQAQAYANIAPETISYIETHGTATSLGDPIEIEALTQAFRIGTDARQFCAIGSVKSNLGHLTAAAGVTGLIKTALSIQHKLLPPTLHFESPNPRIDFASSPFYVNAKLTEWGGETPRRAGVSSFGVGGTNAHVVLEEAPPVPPSSPSRPCQLLLLSAKTSSALEAMVTNLHQYLQQPDLNQPDLNQPDLNQPDLKQPEVKLADVAYTLQTGRKAFSHRRFVVCGDRPADAVSVLAALPPKQTATRYTDRNPNVIFMFPGQGSQYINMGLSLYQSESCFRETVDRCAEILQPLLGRDLRSILYPASQTEAAAEVLKNTFITQPALFTVEYALAQLWRSWGIQPRGMIGHSIGEFVAACLAGVFSLEDALMLVATRGRLMQELPGGSMLSVRSPAATIAPRLGKDLTIAAINAPDLCVVSGSTDAVADLEQQLTAAEIVCKPLHTSHAFHSPMMDAIVEPFAAVVRQVCLNPPQIPFVSTVSATWITPEQTTDPLYWANHLRATVRFADGVRELWQDPTRVLLEVGPRTTAATLARKQADLKKQIAISSLSDTAADQSEWMALLSAIGQLWLAGVAIDWQAFYAGEQRHRVPLPTYPFERKRYWLEAASISSVTESQPVQPIEPAQFKTIAEVLIPPPEETMPRQQQLISQLRTLLEETSGLELADVDEAMTFLEMGLDSLSLTQVGLSLQRQFDIKVTFRQLLEELPTLDHLANFIDRQLPPEESPAPSAPVTASKSIAAPPIPAAAPAATPASTLEAVIAQQLHLMSRQLELLSGTASTPISIPISIASNGHGAAQPLSASNGTVNGSPTGKAADWTATRNGHSAQPENNRTSAIDTEPPKKSFGAIARIDTSDHTELTPSQQACLEAFGQRYTTRTGQSKQYAQAHRAHLADPRTVSGFNRTLKELVYPIVTSRSAGSQLWDLDGNEYIDLTNGFGSNFFGYSAPFITDAIAAQLQQGYEIGPQTPLAGEVAALISEFTKLERVAFCNTGSEAVLGAMRIARTVTGRNTIALFSGAYHGILDEVIVRGTKKLKSIAAAPGIPASAVENVLVLDYDTPESLEILRSRAGELAAILVEPVQSRRPELQPREFLHQLREITHRSGAALIMDEVITGFRIDPGGAQAHFGIQADIATYGKVVGGGMPIGVLAGKPQFMDALDGGFWQFGDDSFPEAGVTYFAGTFIRHPLALAAAKAALLHMKQHGATLQRSLNARTEQFAARLNAYFAQVGVPFRVNSFGSLFKITYPHDLLHAELLFYWLRDKGVHIWDHRPCFLTLAHSDADLEFVLAAFKQSVAELQAAKFLPQPLGQLSFSTTLAGNLAVSHPPIPGARLGRDIKGNPAWYIPNPNKADSYLQLDRPVANLF